MVGTLCHMWIPYYPEQVNLQNAAPDPLYKAGTTTNPAILQKDKVPNCNLKVYKILAKQVCADQPTKSALQKLAFGSEAAAAAAGI